MIRIIFVDDDSSVLHALQRTMHKMRNEWSMEFVLSGDAALKSLARNPADVIVSDVRMPGMDGWQLLAEVKKRYPETVRLVLSGHADSGAIMRLVGNAHQYIAKPGETESLKAAISQTQLLKRLLNSDQLARLVGSVGTLPSCPKAFQDISDCLQRPNASVSEAARIVGRDVAMTANIMKLVNSAFFGARKTITSVDRAVSYLGLDTLAALVLGHSLFQSGKSGCDGISLDGLWQHSLDTAMVARAIALHETLPATRVEDAFLAGMLHDVGRVVYATRNTAASGHSVPSYEDNIEEIAQHHAEVGAYLLGLWGFPSHIVEAIALYHTPGRRADTGLDLTAIVHIADRLTHHQGRKTPIPIELGIEPGLLEGLGLSDRLPLWTTALETLDDRTAA